MTPTIEKPEILRPADSEEAISLDWEQAIHIATLLLKGQYDLPDPEQDPMAPAEILALAALLCAYGVLPEEHGRIQALGDYVLLDTPPPAALAGTPAPGLV